VTEGYDKLTDLRYIKGALYDELGMPIKKLKQSEIQDISGVGSESLMTDDRYKHHSFYHKVYPHTVEYETEVRYNHSYYLPYWVPQETSSYAVQESKLVVTAPKDYLVRYRNFNYRGEPMLTNEGDSKTYTWEVRNMPAVPDEPYAPRWYKRTTSVLLAPAVFELQQYKGSMNTWEELGHFAYILNKGRNELPDAVKQIVHQQTDGLSREEKIAKLYKYLQEHTRYISVQLGIGGWQTFDANYVATKGYGDCKALSNYMCALLQEAGIKASCVLVYAGDDDKDVTEASFPSRRFNHVIVCVPGTKDSTWLECTSSTLPPGYLSGFTADRPVLFVDETGSKLIHTPVYTMEQNQQIRRINATIAETGDMMLKADTRYTGLEQDDMHAMLNKLTREKMLELVRRAGFFASYDVNAYECRQLKTSLPAVDEHLEIAAHNYATVTGKRMFLEPNLLTKTGRRLTSDSARRSDIYLNDAYRDVDTVKITIPEGYTPEAMPQPVALQSIFGAYSSKVTIEGNVITYIRSIDHKGGTYPASAYPELEKFYNGMYKADRARMVLVKK
jgi:transglutaminase-like putative cysteine protease